jgi:ABC-type siderophore export system fused ATPase/permease subunit
VFEQGNDQRFTLFSGVFLDFQGFDQLLFRDGTGADKNLADAHPAVQKICADQITFMEDQLTLTLFTGEAQYTRLTCAVKQLYDVNYGEMFQISF